MKVDSRKTAEEVQQAYTNLVVNSTQFILMMTGAGVFITAILWIGFCRKAPDVVPEQSAV